MSLFVIVTDLAARNRHHRATAVEEADFVGLIHDVSELGSPHRVHPPERWSNAYGANS